MTKSVKFTMHVIACGRELILMFEIKLTDVMEELEQETPTGAVIPAPTGHGQPVLGFEGAQDESDEGFPKLCSKAPMVLFTLKRPDV
jgi:hypothetical protein